MLKHFHLLLALALTLVVMPVSLTAQNIKTISLVNPFIGTSNGGNTFPGAVVPWGMVSVSPHNSLTAPSGYLHNEKDLYGFGMVHLSGTGCAELGSILITFTDKDQAVRPEEYKNNYSLETASPGYFSMNLDDAKMTAEVTASERAGILKFQLQDDSKKTLVIDAGRSLSITGGGAIRIVSADEIEGYNISGGFCGEANREKIYFSARLSRKITGHKLWIGDTIINSGKAEITDSPLGGLFEFDLKSGDEILVKIGISYVSIENAKENLDTEIPGWDFNKIKSEAAGKWEKQLNRMIIEDTSKANLTKFYTAVYHSLVHPNIISDVNGDYPLMGSGGIGNYSDRKRYSVFSLWDTYRTLHPFLTLVYPEIQSEIIKTMIDMYRESGFLPKWELAGIETYMMVGDPASIVIADSYVKGITDFDAQAAMEAMLKPALLKLNEKAPPVRAAYHELLQYGYIPFEQNLNDDWWAWGPVSTSLEYCLSDFAISQMARKLDKPETANEFYARSLRYKNLFDPVSEFIRPRMKDGSWKEPFDPLATEGSGDWTGSGGPGYVEGNAWNYTWFVPHDINGLIELFGGEEKFSRKLYQSFTDNHFTINNEPDIAYPYLFRYVKEDGNKTAQLVQQIMNNDFGTDHNGLPGNDDCGTISAWFIFSALGFYPDCPAKKYYTMGFPLFDKATIKLNPTFYSGEEIIIEKKTDNYDSKILVNNIELPDYHINHNLFKKRITITFN
jgi:predicted alpha-1,2-mannosidase